MRRPYKLRGRRHISPVTGGIVTYLRSYRFANPPD